jgi:hypothetical protein
MGYGMKVWNASGSVLTDDTTRLFNLSGSISFDCPTNSTGPFSGSVSNAGFSNGTAFYFVTNMPITVTAQDDGTGFGGVVLLYNFIEVTVTISGDTLSWSCSPDNTGYFDTRIRILYGWK